MAFNFSGCLFENFWGFHMKISIGILDVGLKFIVNKCSSPPVLFRLSDAFPFLSRASSHWFSFPNCPYLWLSNLLSSPKWQYHVNLTQSFTTFHNLPFCFILISVPIFFGVTRLFWGTFVRTLIQGIRGLICPYWEPELPDILKTCKSSFNLVYISF